MKKANNYIIDGDEDSVQEAFSNIFKTWNIAPCLGSGRNDLKEEKLM